MNKQIEVYNKLRKKVYGLIYPDGIPLEFGCELMWNDGCQDFSDRVCSDIERSDGECFEIGGGHYMYSYELKENLGPDLTLQDIMRVLDPNDYDISGHGTIWWTVRHGGFDYGLESIDFDISKKPKDRKEETLLSILALLDE